MTDPLSPPLLTIRDLTVRFEGLVAISELNLTVPAGQIFALVGPNGAGKTTVLNCISGFVKPTTGSITLAGTPLLPLGVHQRARLGIARTFQLLQLFSSMTVLDNLLVAQHTLLHAGFFQSVLPFGPAKAEDAKARQRARSALTLLGLEQYADQQAGLLPLGIQKLVGVARALVLEPRLLLLDEPAAGITHQEVEHLVATLRRIRDELNMTLFLIEHNMHLVQAVADQISVLDYGRKLAEGEPGQVLTDPAVLAAYLGSESLSTQEVSDAQS